MIAEAFPLHWPVGYRRSPIKKDSKFKQTMDGAQRFLREELTRLGAKNIIVSTNIPLRKDGGMYADQMHRLHPDPGVAVYFKHKERDIVMCCDQYVRVWENVYALGKAIEAIRGLERWGVSEFIERAFTGFTAIDAPQEKNWWDVLNVHRVSTPETIKDSYRKLVKEWHPDIKGEAGETMIRKLNQAYDKAKQERNFV